MGSKLAVERYTCPIIADIVDVMNRLKLTLARLLMVGLGGGKPEDGGVARRDGHPCIELL